MKRFKFIFVMIVVLAMMFANAVGVFAAEEAAGDNNYTVDIKDENNLAGNKWDWDTDGVGNATTIFDDSGMRLENFNKGGSCYAIYKTNKFNEFKYSMYAKLNLTRPSEFVDEGYEFDYSNLYISFMIDAETPSPVYTCPWNGDKAYFSLCFENLQGNDKTIVYMNEVWAGSGATRIQVDTHDDIHWNDGQYHWYEFEVINAEKEDTEQGKPVTYTGKLIKFYFDGELKFEYFQRDQHVYSTYLGKYEDVDFSGTSGYLGFWTSSDFPVGMDTAQTDCYVDIDKMQITSYDDGNEDPYTIAPKPEFDITSVNFSPEASYEAGYEIEVKLSALFSYEGDDALQYTVKSGGQEIGMIRNGFWVWTPEKAGNYDVDFIATNEDGKSATNYVTIRVVGGETTDPGDTDTDTDEGGCGSSIAASVAGLSIIVTLGGAVLLKKKDR